MRVDLSKRRMFASFGLWFGSVVGFEHVRVISSCWCIGAQSFVNVSFPVMSPASLCVPQLEGDLSKWRVRSQERRLELVIARQNELRDVKRVFEARTSVSVHSSPSPHKKKAKRRKGKKDEDDELLDLAMNTAEVLFTELKERC